MTLKEYITVTTSEDKEKKVDIAFHWHSNIAFQSKKNYLDFVEQWKSLYRRYSEATRVMKRHERNHQSNYDKNRNLGVDLLKDADVLRKLASDAQEEWNKVVDECVEALGYSSWEHGHVLKLSVPTLMLLVRTRGKRQSWEEKQLEAATQRTLLV
jgi:hypothetical protein